MSNHMMSYEMTPLEKKSKTNTPNICKHVYCLYKGLWWYIKKAWNVLVYQMTDHREDNPILWSFQHEFHGSNVASNRCHCGKNGYYCWLNFTFVDPLFNTNNQPLHPLPKPNLAFPWEEITNKKPVVVATHAPWINAWPRIELLEIKSIWSEVNLSN